MDENERQIFKYNFILHDSFLFLENFKMTTMPQGTQIYYKHSSSQVSSDAVA